MTVSQRHRWQRAGFLPIAARAAGQLGAWAGKKTAQYIRSRRTENRASPNATQNNVTFQHDYARIYRRRRAPRKLRYRAKKASRRFERSLVRTLGQKTWNRSDVFASGTITPTGLDNSQSIFDLGLFGGIASSNSWGDLNYIASEEDLLTQTGKLHFKSACLDVQIQNSTNNFTTNPAPCTIVVDLYTVYARREGYYTPGTDWQSAMTTQGLLSGTGSLATPLSLNTTPFDGPGFGSSWLITNKMRYRIAPGQSVYLQLREHKRMIFDTTRFEYDASISDTRLKVFKGFTRGYIMVIRSDTPTITDEVPVMNPFSYNVIYTKNYKYARVVSAIDSQVFNP